MHVEAEGQTGAVARGGLSRVLALLALASRGFIALIGAVIRLAGPRPSPVQVAVRRRLPLSKRIARNGLMLLIGSAFGAAMLIPEREPETGDPIRTAAIRTPTRAEPAELRLADDAGPTLILPAELPWLAVKRPLALYNLEAPQVDPAEMTYQVSTRGRDSRRDSLVWRPRADRPGHRNRPSIDIQLERHEKGMPTQRPLYAALAARAAERHLSLERMAAPAEIASKFGPIQVADAVIAGPDGKRGCLVFQRAEMVGFVINGWYCAPEGKAVDRVTLGCFIDRLDLVSAGQDAELRRLFAHAERARGICASARQPGKRITWMDHEAPVPALKLSARR